MSWDTENRGPMPKHLQPGNPSYDRPLGMGSKGRSKEPSEMGKYCVLPGTEGYPQLEAKEPPKLTRLEVTFEADGHTNCVCDAMVEGDGNWRFYPREEGMTRESVITWRLKSLP